MSGVVAAQSMFAAASQAASAASSGASAGGAGEAVQVAMLQKALDSERQSVNVLA
jgi:hypothetical protein